MISVNNITKYYGPKLAVDKISFNVEKGEIVGFLGPNAAGKTTTMRIIAGYLYPTEGDVKVSGIDVIENPREAKKHIGYMPENVPLYNDMPVYSYLKFFASIRGIEKSDIDTHIVETLNKVGIEPELYNKYIGTLSKGYKQRVGLAQALIGNPDILILDEPTVGLDPNQIIAIRKLIKSLQKEHTVILSTHILQEVSAVCNRVIIINEGKLVTIDTQEGLLDKVEGGQRNRVVVEGDAEKVKTLLSKLSDIKSIDIVKSEGEIQEFMISVEKGKDIRKDIAKSIIKNGFGLLELSKVTLSLEEIFSKLTV